MEHLAMDQFLNNHFPDPTINQAYSTYDTTTDDLDFQFHRVAVKLEAHLPTCTAPPTWELIGHLQPGLEQLTRDSLLSLWYTLPGEKWSGVLRESLRNCGLIWGLL